jgi:hypothetical protein
MKPTIVRKDLLLGVLALGLSLPATALAFGGRGACRSDAQTLCPEAQTPPEIHQCLIDHQDQLSDACAANIERMQSRLAAIESACQADIQSLCPGAQAPPEIHQCLRDNHSQLSAACQAALPRRHHPRRGPLAGACRADVQTLCPDAKTPWDIHKCLNDHQGQLSAACSAKLQEVQRRLDAVHAACQADVQTLCPNAATPRDIGQCLHENRDQLSETCSQALRRMHRRHPG